jgi:hypothetical protein
MQSLAGPIAGGQGDRAIAARRTSIPTSILGTRPTQHTPAARPKTVAFSPRRHRSPAHGGPCTPQPAGTPAPYRCAPQTRSCRFGPVRAGSGRFGPVRAGSGRLRPAHADLGRSGPAQAASGPLRPPSGPPQAHGGNNRDLARRWLPPRPTAPIGPTRPCSEDARCHHADTARRLGPRRSPPPRRMQERGAPIFSGAAVS